MREIQGLVEASADELSYSDWEYCVSLVYICLLKTINVFTLTPLRFYS